MARTALVANLWGQGFPVGPMPTVPCEQCSHEWGNHLLVTDDKPLDGGHIMCPFSGCECRQTWGVRALLDNTD